MRPPHHPPLVFSIRNVSARFAPASSGEPPRALRLQLNLSPRALGRFVTGPALPVRYASHVTLSLHRRRRTNARKAGTTTTERRTALVGSANQIGEDAAPLRGALSSPALGREARECSDVASRSKLPCERPARTPGSSSLRSIAGWSRGSRQAPAASDRPRSRCARQLHRGRARGQARRRTSGRATPA